MRRRKPGSLAELLARARLTLGMSQAEFGPALGASQKTALRWEGGRAFPGESAMHELMRLLAPVDLDLARALAAVANHTLEPLGVVVAVPALPAPLATAPALPAESPALPEVTLADRSELVVHAAAEAGDATPGAVRTVLYAAVARALALGLTLEQLEASLRLRVAASDEANAARRVGVRVATRPATTDDAEAEAPSPRRARAH